MSSLEHNMILSASGWRKVFAQSGNEQDFSREIGEENYALSILASRAFAEYLREKKGIESPAIVVAKDTRPTGDEICRAILQALLRIEKISVRFLGVASAPEIMAYAKSADGFIYVSASHNPVGHNGIKFGLCDGGVLSADENAQVKEIFLREIAGVKNVSEFVREYREIEIEGILERRDFFKGESLSAYEKFSSEVISAISDEGARENFFCEFDSILNENKIGVVCDFNGSARTECIDKKFFEKHNVDFLSMNDVSGKIAHEIIPEPENLVHVQKFLKETRAKSGNEKFVLGYMCDCDGDRGNLVYWSERENAAKILKAQEVFSLSVLAELSYMAWLFGRGAEARKMAVAVNCPTSMRIDEIAKAFGAKVFRAEVGEANVVNLARELRSKGFAVRILGEGSNGGTITHPSCVRDPLNTVFAIIKLLAIRDRRVDGGEEKKGLFHLWCEATGVPYKKDFTLDDIIASLPKYTTTGVSESRALLKVHSRDIALLKKNFQSEFERSFASDSEGFVKKYSITSWSASLTNGTKEVSQASDFSKSGTGGLKILFYEKGSQVPASFIWMRPSGTEPVFRILCDVKGSDAQKEKDLLSWETKLLQKADVEN